MSISRTANDWLRRDTFLEREKLDPAVFRFDGLFVHTLVLYDQRSSQITRVTGSLGKRFDKRLVNDRGAGACVFQVIAIVISGQQWIHHCDHRANPRGAKP